MKYLFISTLLLALVAFSNAQATWYVEEVWKSAPNCSALALNGIVTYTAFRAGLCGSVDGSYRKYTCGTSSAIVSICSDAACSSRCSTSTLDFATCRSFNNTQTLFTARCGALPSGTQGLSSISYIDNDCKESFGRVFTLDNFCAATEVSSGNVTINNSIKLSCDGTKSVVISSCPGSATCGTCTTANVDQNKCNGNSKYVCGASDVAAASAIHMSFAIVILASIATLML